MGDSLKETGSHKLDVTWMLTEEEISEIRKHHVAGTRCELFSQKFGSGAWKLQFDSRHEEDLKPHVYLFARPRLQDARSSSSTRSWSRKGHFEWKISIVLEVPSASIDTKQITLNGSFDSDETNWGRGLKMTVEQILEIYDQQKSFGFRCVLSGDVYPQKSSSLSTPILHLFDSSSYADTVFVIHASEGGPFHIFACKEILVSGSSHFKTLFESGFSESNSTRRFDIAKLAKYEDEDGASISRFIDEQLLPFLPPTQLKDPAPQATQEAPVIDDSIENSASSEPSRKRIKLEEAVEGSPSNTGDGKLLNVVDIHEIDFRTFRAMVRYLHFPMVPFHPLASDYLVEKSKNNALDKSPLDWLSDKFWDIDDLYNEDIDPCSSSAMYRLADLYDLEDLRDLSLGFIVRGLNVENAAYELFSPLSLDYDAVQKPILEFLVKNCPAICKTQGFKAVIEQFSLGNLTKGKDLMIKIVEMVSES